MIENAKDGFCVNAYRARSDEKSGICAKNEVRSMLIARILFMEI